MVASRGVVERISRRGCGESVVRIRYWRTCSSAEDGTEEEVQKEAVAGEAIATIRESVPEQAFRLRQRQILPIVRGR